MNGKLAILTSEIGSQIPVVVKRDGMDLKIMVNVGGEAS
jgi:hypothetical protein